MASAAAGHLRLLVAAASGTAAPLSRAATAGGASEELVLSSGHSALIQLVRTGGKTYLRLGVAAVAHLGLPLSANDRSVLGSLDAAFGERWFVLPGGRLSAVAGRARSAGSAVADVEAQLLQAIAAESSASRAAGPRGSRIVLSGSLERATKAVLPRLQALAAVVPGAARLAGDAGSAASSYQAVLLADRAGRLTSVTLRLHAGTDAATLRAVVSHRPLQISAPRVAARFPLQQLSDLLAGPFSSFAAGRRP